MNRGTLIIIVATVAIAVAAAVMLIPMLDKGLASQSETDSIDDLEPGQYVKATSSDGNAVSIPAVTYTLSEDKEFYELAGLERSSSGSLRVKTPNNAEMGLRVLIEFQNQGSWMFIESIDIVMKRQLGFVVLVENGTSLGETTVLKVDANGISIATQTEGKVDVSGWTSGCMVWGSGTPITGEYPVDTKDANNGFIILVDADYNINGYNIVKIYKNSVSIDREKSVGYSLINSDKDR